MGTGADIAGDAVGNAMGVIPQPALEASIEPILVSLVPKIDEMTADKTIQELSRTAPGLCRAVALEYLRSAKASSTGHFSPAKTSSSQRVQLKHLPPKQPSRDELKHLSLLRSTKAFSISVQLKHLSAKQSSPKRGKSHHSKVGRNSLGSSFHSDPPIQCFRAFTV